MSAIFYRKAGSVGIPLFIQLTDQFGRAVDLTDATSASVSLRARGSTGAADVDASAADIAVGEYDVPGRGTVTLAKTDGVVVWQPVEAEIGNVETFDGLVRVVFPTDKTLIAPDEGMFTLIVSEAF